MPSILPGYSYDIFVSYRQNDNRSGWVTDFVTSLREELAATVKEPVSIYFDAHPIDGLLETHDVDESLNDKLKCVIFIPIISQTYCDPKSFAWSKEFLRFKQLSQAGTGLKVTVHNGNVSSRILPIRIHEIDHADKLMIEQEIGPLRSIDFIFRTAGVNRPLHIHEDHPHQNLNNTYYRDQINKVANTVKGILTHGVPAKAIPSSKSKPPAGAVSDKQMILGIALGLLFAFVFIMYYFFLRKDNGRRSKAEHSTEMSKELLSQRFNSETYVHY